MRQQRTLPATRALPVVLLPVILAACSSTPGAGSSGPVQTGGANRGQEISTTYDVRYQSGVGVIDETTAATLIASEENGRTLRFPASAGAVRDLKPGQPLLVSGVAIGRVRSVEPSANEIVVRTDPVALGEIVESGQIASSHRVHWNSLPEGTYKQAAAAFLVAMAGPAAPPREARLASAGDKFTYTGKKGGWQYSVSFTPGPGKLEFELKAERDFGGSGSKASVSAKGWVSDFRHDFELRYDRGTGTAFEERITELTGEVETEWHAAAIDQMLRDVLSWTIPLPIVIPFAVGPIPCALTLKVVASVVPELAQQQDTSGGHFKIEFSSDQGFTISGKKVDGLGSLKSATLGSLGDTVSAGFGVVGFGFGVEFPRFELSVFGSTVAFVTLKSYTASLWTRGTTLTADIPPCQKATASLLAVAGYRLAVLGFDLGDGQKELFRKEVEKTKDGKPCDLTGGQS